MRGAGQLNDKVRTETRGRARERGSQSGVSEMRVVHRRG